MLTIRYYDRAKGENVVLPLPEGTDVVTVEVAEQPEYNGQPAWYLPALTVNVNTDAVIIDKGGERVSMYEYTDVLSEARML